MQIATEARLIFYKKNNFCVRLKPDEIEQFVEHSEATMTNPEMRRFAIDLRYTRDDTGVVSFPSNLNLLLRFQNLEQLHVRISSRSMGYLSRPELARALKDLAKACEQLHARLGGQLRFFVNPYCYQSGAVALTTINSLLECTIERLKNCAMIYGVSRTQRSGVQELPCETRDLVQIMMEGDEWRRSGPVLGNLC